MKLSELKKYSTLHIDTDNLKILADEYKDRLSIFSSIIQFIYAKFNEFEIFIEELNTINFKFNVICLQEIWITDNSDLSQLQLYHSREKLQ